MQGRAFDRLKLSDTDIEKRFVTDLVWTLHIGIIALKVHIVKKGNVSYVRFHRTDSMCIASEETGPAH